MNEVAMGTAFFCDDEEDREEAHAGDPETEGDRPIDEEEGDDWPRRT